MPDFLYKSEFETDAIAQNRDIKEEDLPSKFTRPFLTDVYAQFPGKAELRRSN